MPRLPSAPLLAALKFQRLPFDPHHDTVVQQYRLLGGQLRQANVFIPHPTLNQNHSMLSRGASRLKSVLSWSSKQRTPKTPFLEEALSRYCPGGYHPVRVGDVFNDGKYKVIRKLGYGVYSTVWLACDLK